MKTRNGIRGMLYFLAGAAFTFVLMLGFFNSQDARADDPLGCIKQDLKVSYMGGNLGMSLFGIQYKAPSCYAQAGYRIKQAYTPNDDTVMLMYTKK